MFDEYVYSTDDEHFTDYDTIMEELECEYEPGTRCAISRGIPIQRTHSDYVQPLRIIEEIQEIGYEDSEYLDNYLQLLSDETEQRIKDAIVAILNEVADQPNVFIVDKIEEIIVTVGED